MQDTAQYIHGVMHDTADTAQSTQGAVCKTQRSTYMESYARHSRHSAEHSRRRMQDTAQYIDGVLCTTEPTRRRALKAPYARHSAVHTWSHARHSRHSAGHSRRRMQDTAQYINGALCTTQPTQRRALKAPYSRHSAVHTWSHARHSRHGAEHSRRRMKDTAQCTQKALCKTLRSKHTRKRA